MVFAGLVAAPIPGAETGPSSARLDATDTPDNAADNALATDEQAVLDWLRLRRRWWREPPDAPDAPTVEAESSSSLTVTWTPPAYSATEVHDYDVEYRRDETAVFSDWPHVGVDTSATISGLAPSTKHHVRVRAANDAGPGDWSTTSVATTANAVPVFGEGARTTRTLAENTPAGRDIGLPVSATDAGTDTLNYAVDGPGAGSVDIVPSTGQLRTRPGVRYDHESTPSIDVTVTVDDSQGGNARIDVTITVTDVDEPPGRPRAPIVSGASTTTLVATWRPPANNGPPILDYDVGYRTGAGVFIDAGHVGTSRVTTLSGLAVSSEYEVRVRASNEEGTGKWSAVGTGRTSTNQPPVFGEGTSTRRELAENTPANRTIGAPLTATDPDGDTLTYRLGGADAGRFVLGTSNGQLRTRPGATYDHEADATHLVTVTAVDGQGNQARIAVTIAVTDQDEPPLAPAAPSLRESGSDSLDVFWSAPGNTGRPAITGYNVRYSSGGAFIDWPGTVTITYAELTGLAKGDYQVQVRALNAEGDGAWSRSGHASIGGNNAPVVDESLLRDVTVAVGGRDLLVGVGAAFSDPDGDSLTFAAASRNDATATATAIASGSRVRVHAVAVGTVEVDVTATDPQGAAATGSFTVTVVAAPPPAPVLSLSPAQDILTVAITDTYAPLEARAYSIRVRPKSQPTDSHGYCATFTSRVNATAVITAGVPIPIGTFVQPNTVYEVYYRYRGESCSDSVGSAWSVVAEIRTAVLDGDFDIDIVFVGDEPSATVKSAINAAATLWERAITNDPTDIDFSGNPASNPCTDGEFDGVVDDLRIYVRVTSIDGPEGTLGDAGVCNVRDISGLPIIALINLDSDDLNQLGYSLVHRVAVHEIGHTLGFGLFWGNLLVNPSLQGGQPITPPPDTHFNGANAVAAFDAAGGSSYQGGKVPVENERGGQGAQDVHWRKSVMGSELMTPTIGGRSPFSAITIQSMADLGYAVDASVADPYTVFNVSGQALPPAAVAADQEFLLRCDTAPLGDVEYMPEFQPETPRHSNYDVRVIPVLD